MKDTERAQTGELTHEIRSGLANHRDHGDVVFDKGNGPFCDCDSDQGHLHRRKDTTAQIVPESIPPGYVEF